MTCCTPPTVPHPAANPKEIFQGTIKRKPWHYRITAIIPCLNHSAETAVSVTLLRLQTIKPYILLIDTGSNAHHATALHNLRAEDLELHTIRSNSTAHPSAPITAALDLGFSLAWTPYAFTTHQDCFLRSRGFLSYLSDEMHLYDVVGYQLSPRNFPGWQKWFGHTATMWSTNALDRIGATWSLRRAIQYLPIGPIHTAADPMGMLDTETCMNLAIEHAGLRTKQVGTERNRERTVDQWIDHCRSLISSGIYDPEHHALAAEWTEDALSAARERIDTWTRNGEAEPEPETLDN